MATAKNIANGILRAIGILSVICVIGWFLYEISTVILYIISAIILTLIGNPILKFLKRKLKFPNLLATIVTLFFFVLIIVGFILMFVPLITSQSESLSVLKTATIESNVRELLNQVDVFLARYDINSDQFLKDSNINFHFIPNFLNSVLGILSSFGMGLASTLFITFFFLKDKRMFTIGIKKILPKSHEEQILNSFDKIDDLLSRYFLGLLLQLFIVFVLYWVVLLIFGIKNGFVIAFLCAVLNIIPYIGPLIGTVLAGVLTMISNLGSDFQSEILPKTLWVLLGFWIVQIIDNNVSQPMIFSKSTDSHPLEIFLVILIAGFLSGILGMIVAVPLYTMLKVIGKEFLPENKIIRMLTKNI